MPLQRRQRQNDFCPQSLNLIQISAPQRHLLGLALCSYIAWTNLFRYNEIFQQPQYKAGSLQSELDSILPELRYLQESLESRNGGE